MTGRNVGNPLVANAREPGGGQAIKFLNRSAGFDSEK